MAESAGSRTVTLATPLALLLAMKLAILGIDSMLLIFGRVIANLLFLVVQAIFTPTDSIACASGFVMLSGGEGTAIGAGVGTGVGAILGQAIGRDTASTLIGTELVQRSAV